VISYYRVCYYLFMVSEFWSPSTPESASNNIIYYARDDINPAETLKVRLLISVIIIILIVIHTIRSIYYIKLTEFFRNYWKIFRGYDGQSTLLLRHVRVRGREDFVVFRGQSAGRTEFRQLTVGEVQRRFEAAFSLHSG